jgi:hypothetical protein
MTRRVRAAKRASQNNALLVVFNPDDKPLLLSESGILIAPRRVVGSDAPGLATTHRSSGRHDRSDSYHKKTKRHSACPAGAFTHTRKGKATGALSRRSLVAGAAALPHKGFCNFRIWKSPMLWVLPSRHIESGVPAAGLENGGQFRTSASGKACLTTGSTERAKTFSVAAPAAGTDDGERAASAASH